MKVIDANIILRCVLNDNAELSQKAKSIIEENWCFAPNEVVAEVVFVLQKVYEVPREEISRIVGVSFGYYQVENETLLKTALEYFAQTSLDFVDCILAACSAVNFDEVFTLDKKLNNFIRRIR